MADFHASLKRRLRRALIADSAEGLGLRSSMACVVLEDMTYILRHICGAIKDAGIEIRVE